ncbi:MAG: DUF5698 domain-containing protein [Syntrophomonadaceae bacterium]
MALELLFIFLARIIDVSLGTIRMILVIRGDKVPAAIIGFFEILVYTLALGLVVGSLRQPSQADCLLQRICLRRFTGQFFGRTFSYGI